MKYLVLGSHGQVGNALCQYLREKNQEVLEFDIATHPMHDLRIPGRAEEAIHASDFVFFLAFDVGGSRYLKEYQHSFQFIDNNIRLMQATFESLQHHHKPFIFASSQMSNMTFSSYGTLKSLGEFYTKTLGGLIVKFWNVYGIEHDPTKTHVITDFVEMALKNKEIRMRTDGDEERQFLYARDCSEALFTLAQKYTEIPRNRNLHITNFEWLKIIDIAKQIAILVGDVQIIPGKDKDTVQQGHRNEPDPFILELWKPTTNISDGIAKIIEHYQSK